MKKIKKILSIFIVGILSVCTISLVGCKGNTNSTSELNGGSFKITPSQNSNITITTLCSEVVTTGTDAFISQNLIATITKPDGSTTTDCSWAVKWGDNPLDEDVSNYIKLTTLTSQNAVSVICYKPFYGSTILVQVTDNETGNTATCVCEYIGVPSNTYFEYENTIYTTYAELTLDQGQYTFDLGLLNALGPVDSSSAQFELGTVYGSGQFEAISSTRGSSTDITVDMSNVVDNFISGCTINGNSLTFNLNQSVNTYYVTGGNGYVQFKDYIYSAQTGKPTSCSIKIPITEKTTGKSLLIDISPLSNVTLSNNSLQF